MSARKNVMISFHDGTFSDCSRIGSGQQALVDRVVVRIIIMVIIVVNVSIISTLWKSETIALSLYDGLLP